MRGKLAEHFIEERKRLGSVALGRKRPLQRLEAFNQHLPIVYGEKNDSVRYGIEGFEVDDGKGGFCGGRFSLNKKNEARR